MAYIRCWTCNGNGVVVYPRCSAERCPACNGTGCDVGKTRASTDMLESEKTYPSRQYGPEPK